MSLLMSAAARGNAANGADSDLLGGYQKPDWLRKMASPSIHERKGLPRKSSPINSAAEWRLQVFCMSKIKSECVVCGTVFFVKPYEIKRGKGKCCSLSCASSLSAKNRVCQKGESNPNWKGGISKDLKARLKTRQDYRANDAVRYAAHREAFNAIRRGELVRKPCEVCGESKVDAHHDDYSKPLDVRWLCREHHMQHHARLDAKQLGIKP